MVRRPDRDMVLRQETTSPPTSPHSVRYGKCRVPQPIVVTFGRHQKMWGVDWVTIFEKVRFRCRCGSLANALKVERHTHDRPEEVLFVHKQTG